MYVTAQDTQSLLLYDVKTGMPDTSTPSNALYPGSIATYSAFNDDSNGIRDVVVDEVNGLVFVAEEVLRMVLVYDVNANYINVFNISFGSKSVPIGLAMDQSLHPNIVFVGDNGHEAVYAFMYYPSQRSFNQLWKSEKVSDLTHPAGLAVNEQLVFVVEQKNNLIMTFNVSTGKNEPIFADFTKLDVIGENLYYVYDDQCL